MHGPNDCMDSIGSTAHSTQLVPLAMSKEKKWIDVIKESMFTSIPCFV